MKLALVFLACFVSLSTQQGYWPYMAHSPYYSPRLFYWPWGFDQSQYYQQPARMSYRGDSSGTGSPMGRFFFQNGGFPGGFFGMRPGGGGNFGTTTVFGTMTSTAIVANFLSCIPAVQFTSSSSVQATNPCARRKRLAAEIMDALEEAFDTPDVVPSVVAPVEATALPDPVEQTSEPSIESSQNDVINDDETAIKRQGRAGFNYVTVSSWITTYSFITTNVKKTYTLANSAVLQCLPPGFVVC